MRQLWLRAAGPHEGKAGLHMVTAGTPAGIGRACQRVVRRATRGSNETRELELSSERQRQKTREEGCWADSEEAASSSEDNHEGHSRGPGGFMTDSRTKGIQLSA